MRFCIPIPCFFDENKISFYDAIRKVKEWGFDAAETYQWKHLDMEKIRAVCAETGVELLSMCTTEFDMVNPEKRQLWLDGLKESCQAAKAAGVKRLITQVGADTGAERSVQHQSIVDALCAAKPILEESGVTIMVEALNTYVDHPGYYLWSSREAFDIIREVNHPLVKVVFDMYHQQVMEGNIIPSIRQNLDCIAHLHAAGHPGRHELQYGENDYHVIFDAIEQTGYQGACGLEYYPTMDSEESLKTFRRLYLK